MWSILMQKEREIKNKSWTAFVCIIPKTMSIKCQERCFGRTSHPILFHWSCFHTCNILIPLQWKFNHLKIFFVVSVSLLDLILQGSSKNLPQSCTLRFGPAVVSKTFFSFSLSSYIDPWNSCDFLFPWYHYSVSSLNTQLNKSEHLCSFWMLLMTLGRLDIFRN